MRWVLSLSLLAPPPPTCNPQCLLSHNCPPSYQRSAPFSVAKPQPSCPRSHKSGALLIRETAPHYLISGAGQIHIAQSDNLLNWTLGPLFIAKTLWGNPNVEAGPPPMRLADGNYVYGNFLTFSRL